MSRMLLTIAISVLSLSASARMDTKVVYGNDDRLDVYQVSDARIRELSDSTVALIQGRKLAATGRGTMAIKSSVYGEEYGLCKDEPYFNQPTGAMCSGFMVGDDLIATAGHCVDTSSCADMNFAFGFRMNGANNPPGELPTSEIYRCKQIVARELTRNQDYALVRVDRPIVGHRALRLAAANPAANEAIFVIGHPAGLPTKVAGGANVRSLQQGFFMANMDTYGGNSGSAVFSSVDGSVTGILVRGERDFARDAANNCNRSNYCPDSGCRGEDATYISYIRTALGQ